MAIPKREEMQNGPQKYLIVDAGNSRTKVWRLEEGMVVSHFSFDNQGIESHKPFFAKPDWSAVLVSNSGWAENEIRSWFPYSKLVFLHHVHNLGIKWAYPTPEELGKDRIAALIGASKQMPGKNICVADAGTCLTIDCLDSEQNHLGGLIAPGLKMRFKSMHELTKSLPLSSENELVGPFGNSTASCLASGAVWGMVAEIEFHFEQFRAAGFDDPVLIITGGDADFLAARVKVPNFVVSDLVFQGMTAVLASLV